MFKSQRCGIIEKDFDPNCLGYNRILVLGRFTGTVLSCQKEF